MGLFIGGVLFHHYLLPKSKHYLGKIENHKIILSDFGKIIEKEWHESFPLRRELFLDEFILMPNHLHAIIIINPAIINNPVQTYGRVSQNKKKRIQYDNL